MPKQLNTPRNKKQAPTSAEQQSVSGNRYNDSNYFDDQSPAKIALIDVLLFFDNQYSCIYPSQDTIAKMVGITRSYCNQLIGQLIEDGILSSQYRHMRSCIYKITTYFHDLEVRTKLRKFFRALKWLPIILLTQYKDISFLKDPSFFPKVIYNPNRIRNERLSMEKVVMETKVSKIDISTTKEIPVSPIIREIREIRLTKWGMITLSAFPDEAIRFAVSQLRNPKMLRNPFGLLYNKCKEYCQMKKIRPDWEWFNHLRDTYQMPNDAPMIEQQSLLVVPVKQPTYTITAIKTSKRTPVEEIQFCHETITKLEQDSLIPPDIRRSGIRGLQNMINETEQLTGITITVWGS